MMSKSKRSEIRMLREFAHFFLPHIPCFFCHKPLLDEKVEKFGRGPWRHKPITTGLTLHHDDENKANNSYEIEMKWSKGKLTFGLLGNLKPCHRSCHKAHHAKETAVKKKLGGTRRKSAKKYTSSIGWIDLSDK